MQDTLAGKGETNNQKKPERGEEYSGFTPIKISTDLVDESESEWQSTNRAAQVQR